MWYWVYCFPTINHLGVWIEKKIYTNPARGIPDYCKQKLLAPPLEPCNHLQQCSACTEDEEPIQNIKGPPPGGA